jgi:hypothetical protein
LNVSILFFQTSLEKKKFEICIANKHSISNDFIEHINHKFLDIFKTTINLSPTNKNKKKNNKCPTKQKTLPAQQSGFNDQFIIKKKPKTIQKGKIIIMDNQIFYI